MITNALAFLLLITGGLLALFVTGHAWLGFALMFIGAVILIYKALLCFRRKGHKKPGNILLFVFTAVLAAGVGYFTVVECAVIADMRADAYGIPQYVIVLGAGVNGDVPSLSLQDRLDRTLDFMEANPEVKAVVSGCQGDGENISEADCMASWLERQGIAQERILQEEQAGSTYENFTYSLELIREDCGFMPDTVGVVTAEYHMHRARLIAGSLGEKVISIPARTSIPTMMVSYLIREAFGVTQFYVFGR